MYFPNEEYEARWSRVYAEMAARDLQTCVVWQRSGGGYDRAGAVQWLCNYAAASSGQETGGPGWYVGRAFAALVFHADRVPELHIIEPEDSIPAGEIAEVDVVEHSLNLPEGLGEHLVSRGIGGPVGYVGYDFLPVQIQQTLEAASAGIEWVAHDDLLFAPQKVKSARELDLYREAGAISSRALTAMMEALIAGERESDAAAKAAAIVVAAGGAFHRIGVHHGSTSEAAMWSNPFYGFNTRKPQPGDLVRAFVYGPIKEGYWIDPGRTAVCGNSPTPEQRQFVEDGAQLTEDVMTHCVAGNTAREIGRAGDALLDAVSGDDAQKGAIWPIYGHGLGYFFMPPMLLSEAGAPDKSVHDSPYLGLDDPLEPGQICTVETFITREGIGTTGFEQVFIVQDNGIEVLTDTPMLFW
jgi:Xaa-Pro aminopeptidase